MSREFELGYLLLNEVQRKFIDMVYHSCHPKLQAIDLYILSTR